MRGLGGWKCVPGEPPENRPRPRVPSARTRRQVRHAEVRVIAQLLWNEELERGASLLFGRTYLPIMQRRT